MMNRESSSKIFRWLFRVFIPPEDREYFSTSVSEVYETISREKGKTSAFIWVLSQFIKSLPSFLQYLIGGYASILNNYIKIALRNMYRHKSFSIIHITCLALGLACCILMLLWVYDEFSFDRFHENVDSLYRIISEVKTPAETYQEAGAPAALAKALKENYPEIIDATRYIGVPKGWLLQYEDKSFLNDRLGSADPSFFEMFTFPFIKGDPKTALDEPYSMVITDKMANKYFGNDDPLGKIIKVHSKGFKVTGILDNVPTNSHLQFDFIFPITFWKEAWGMDLKGWKGSRYHTYIQLKEGSSEKNFEDKISGIVKQYDPEIDCTLHLQSLKKIHLYSNFRNDLWGHGSIKTVIIFLCSATCILLIACINFMNLSTARSANRAKEISMRKVTGARRRDIIKQFLGESILIALFSFFIGLFLVSFVIPTFNHITGKALSITSFSHIEILFGCIIVTLLTGIIAGSYPAIFLSSFQPYHILRGVFFKQTHGRVSIREILVIMQFAMTTIFIIGSVAIFNQLKYTNSKDLGFQRNHIVYFLARGGFGSNYAVAKQTLLQNAHILNVTKSIPPFGSRTGSSQLDVHWEEENANHQVMMQHIEVDNDYLETFDMEMVKGRFFSKEYVSDRSNYILNEAAVRAMGLKSPVGKRFSFQGREGSIIGVINDFHQHSLHHEILPLFLQFSENNMYVCVRIDSKQVTETIRFLEKKWNEFVPGFPFTYDFLDDTIDSAYTTEKQVSSVLLYFTMLAIIVACMGLFGLASFSAEQRTKEIGIRKVLGASMTKLFILQSKEYAKWMLIANIVAWPIAYFLIKQWLQRFAYRMNIGLEIFIVASAMVLGIALVSVSQQAIRAARRNPVESLKYE